jgi:hypothetical protein
MSVRAYYHDDPEAPVLDGTAGSLVQLLKKCLVDGYGNVGQGTWKDPLGWEGLYDSVFQQAGFRSADLSSTRTWLLVTDDGSHTGGAPYATARGYGAFTGFDGSDIPQGLTGEFPTVAQRADYGLIKSNAADGTSRRWLLFGDERLFYLFVEPLDTYVGHFSGHVFGDALSYRTGDVGHAVLLGSPLTTPNGWPRDQTTFHVLNVVTTGIPFGYAHLRTNYNGLAESVPAGFVRTCGCGTTVMGQGGLEYPHPVDGSLVVAAVHLGEALAAAAPLQYLRGTLPGLYYTPHTRPAAHRATVAAVEGLAGRTLQFVSLAAGNATGDNYTGRCMIDLTGPWR